MIRPNDNFLSELQKFEKELFGLEKPSFTHEELPPMKSNQKPSIKRQPKEIDEWVGKRLSEQDMEAIANNTYHHNSKRTFMKDLEKYFGSKFKEDMEKDEYKEKTIQKSLQRIGSSFYSKKLREIHDKETPNNNNDEEKN